MICWSRSPPSTSPRSCSGESRSPIGTCAGARRRAIVATRSGNARALMRMFLRRGVFNNLGPALAATVTLFGCGSGETPGVAGGAAKPATAPRKTQPGDVVSPNMVSAVSSARTGPASVQVKFELRERPDVAQPLDIDLVILPGSATVDRLYGRVEVADGLQLTEGAQIAPSDRPGDGIPIRHSIKVLPTRDGIFTVNAVGSVDSAGQSWSQTFSIPVIVGAGSAVPVKSSSAAAATKPAAASR